MMQIMFSDFRSAEPGLFRSFCVSLSSFDIVLLSQPPPRRVPDRQQFHTLSPDVSRVHHQFLIIFGFGGPGKKE